MPKVGRASAALVTLALLWHGRPSSFTLQRVSYGQKLAQEGDLLVPEGRCRGLVMLIHGGFWKAGFDRSLEIQVANYLISQDLCVWNVDYRAVGSGGGYPQTLSDVSQALAWLGTGEAEGLGVSKDLPLVVVGHSAGGHLAAWLGLQSLLEDKEQLRPRLVIAQAGVLDFKSAYEAHLGQGAVRDFLDTPLPESCASPLLAAANGAVADLLSKPRPDAEKRLAASDPLTLLRRVPPQRWTSEAHFGTGWLSVVERNVLF